MKRKLVITFEFDDVLCFPEGECILAEAEVKAYALDIVKEAIFHHRDEFVKAELDNVLFPWDTNTVHPVLMSASSA